MPGADHEPGRAAWRIIRSRKLAMSLLLVSAAYQALAVSVPALGRDSFSSPLFLLIAALLGLSTAACAWERSSRAVHALREQEGVPASVVSRLERSSAIVMLGGDGEAVRARVRAALESLGMKVRGTPRVLRGRSSRYGVVGSPIFHWALAALFFLIPLGRLSRSEGLIGVPEGERGVVHTASAYGRLDRGPFYPDALNGVILKVPQLSARTRDDGLDLGLVPLVRLERDGRSLAESAVYPNHPLRYGSVMVHFDGWGFHGRFGTLGPDGQPGDETTAFFDIDEKSLGPAVVTLTPPDGTPLDVTIQPLAGAENRGESDGRHVSFQWTTRSGEEASAVVAVGADAQIEGSVVRFIEAGRYARLSFVDDWSVYPLYALLTLALIGLAVAILAPRRTAWVSLMDTPSGIEVRVLAVHDRRDRVFAIMVEDALSDLATEKDFS